MESLKEFIGNVIEQMILNDKEVKIEIKKEKEGIFKVRLEELL